MSNTNQTASLIITLIIAAVLFATNPKEYELREHIKKNLKHEAVEAGGFGGFVQNLFAGPEAWLNSIYIERKNMYVFSLYKVDGLDGQRKFLGILGTFIEV
jgi:hypothetical protein